jgi:hypothetical protein
MAQAVGRWLSGDGFEVESATVPTAVWEASQTAIEELDGVPAEDRWQARRERARRSDNVAAIRANQRPPWPELWEHQRVEMAARAGVS